MPTTKQILIDARALLSDPKNFTQSGYYAVDAGGNEVKPTSPQACAFCSIGAVNKVQGQDTDYSDALSHLRKTVKSTKKQLLTTYSDTHTHAEVLALFDEAIANAPDDSTNQESNSDC